MLYVANQTPFVQSFIYPVGAFGGIGGRDIQPGTQVAINETADTLTRLIAFHAVHMVPLSVITPGYIGLGYQYSTPIAGIPLAA